LARSKQDEARDAGGAEAYFEYAAGADKERNEVMRRSSPMPRGGQRSHAMLIADAGR
jgi:hypothetical protein